MEKSRKNNLKTGIIIVSCQQVWGYSRKSRLPWGDWGADGAILHLDKLGGPYGEPAGGDGIPQTKGAEFLLWAGPVLGYQDHQEPASTPSGLHTYKKKRINLG